MEDKSKYIRCKRCNRLLYADLARSRGYGEHCWKLHLKENEVKNVLFKIKTTKD